MAYDGTTLLNSLLGDYYMALTAAPYKRPSPFSKSDFRDNVNYVAFLPLPTELKDSTGARWTDTDLGTIGDALNHQFSAGAIAMRNAGDAASTIGSRIGGLIGDAISSSSDQLTSALSLSLGLAPNPNPSVMFTGPELRDFSFSWQFFPKNADESRRVKQLCDALKRKQLPENYITNSAAILKYPHIVQLNFYPWDNISKQKTEWGWGEESIIKIKRCVMTSVVVNYTASNIPAFFEGTQLPVSVQLSIAFKEIEYMLSGDYGGSTGINYSTAEKNVVQSLQEANAAKVFTDANGNKYIKAEDPNATTQ